MNGCRCGHGAYNHGGGWTLIDQVIADHSRCIRCDCMQFDPLADGEAAPCAPSQDDTDPLAKVARSHDDRAVARTERRLHDAG